MSKYPDRLHEPVPRPARFENLQLTWRDVFDCNKTRLGHMGLYLRLAYDAGYEYICWNDHIFNVYGTDTGLLAKDVK